MKFFDELKRRNVIKASLAYLVVAWVLLQVVEFLLPMFEAPEWVLKGVTLLMAIGLPIWIVISWIYDIGPEGIEKTSKDSDNELKTELTNKRLNVFIIVGLSIAVVVLVLNQFVFSIDSDKEYSIAVLPFDNMSSDEDNEYFSDGVTEAILTNLSKIKSLTVISRTSTKRYKGTNKSIPEIAKELGVNYILEGSVGKDDDDIRITAQLISSEDEHVWADNYDRKYDDIFIIQTEVAQKIAQQLKIAINPDEEKALALAPTTSLKAYDLLLKARSFSDKNTQEDFNIAINLFEQAIDLDPNFAEAYIEMAFCYQNNLSLNNNDHDRNLIKIRNLVDKALTLNPNLAKAHSLLGLKYFNNGEREKAIEHYEKALRLNPNDAVAHAHMAIFYARDRMGDLSKSLYEIEQSAKLDPFSPLINYYKIIILLRNDKLVEAEELFKKRYSLFSEGRKEFLEDYILTNKARVISLDKKDWTETIKFYEKEIEKDSLKSSLYRKLGNSYNSILNDDENYIKYLKKAYAIDSTSDSNGGFYCEALVEGKRFEEAKVLMNSENYKNTLTKSAELYSYFNYYYHKGDYDAAQEFLKDSVMSFLQYERALILAQKGNVDGALDIINNNKNDIRGYSKVIIFAILKNKDSMYYYIDPDANKDDETWNIKSRIALFSLNSRREADPYRKEERYKAILRKHYLPITHWNE